MAIAVGNVGTTSNHDIAMDENDNDHMWGLISPQELASILPMGCQKVLLIDSRSFLEYNTSAIQQSVNISCSKLVKRHLQHHQVDIGDLVYQSCQLDVDSTWDVILYDQCTHDPAVFTSDNFVHVLLTRLAASFNSVNFLSGGFLAFQALYPRQVEKKVCNRSFRCSALTSLSQPCLPVSNVGPTRILPFLYLGSSRDALSIDTAQITGINYVLNVSMNCPRPKHVQDGHFHRIPIGDNYSENILPFISEAFQFIDKVREANGCVLVHCLAGISRSPTLAIAYIMKTMHLSSDDAYRYVKDKRPTISPNFNFLGQLLEYEHMLHREQEEEQPRFQGESLGASISDSSSMVVDKPAEHCQTPIPYVAHEPIVAQHTGFPCSPHKTLSSDHAVDPQTGFPCSIPEKSPNSDQQARFPCSPPQKSPSANHHLQTGFPCSTSEKSPSTNQHLFDQQTGFPCPLLNTETTPSHYLQTSLSNEVKIVEGGVSLFPTDNTLNLGVVFSSCSQRNVHKADSVESAELSDKQFSVFSCDRLARKECQSDKDSCESSPAVITSSLYQNVETDLPTQTGLPGLNLKSPVNQQPSRSGKGVCPSLEPSSHAADSQHAYLPPPPSPGPTPICTGSHSKDLGNTPHSPSPFPGPTSIHTSHLKETQHIPLPHSPFPGPTHTSPGSHPNHSNKTARPGPAGFAFRKRVRPASSDVHDDYGVLSKISSRTVVSHVSEENTFSSGTDIHKKHIYCSKMDECSNVIVNDVHRKNHFTSENNNEFEKWIVSEKCVVSRSVSTSTCASREKSSMSLSSSSSLAPPTSSTFLRENTTVNNTFAKSPVIPSFLPLEMSNHSKTVPFLSSSVSSPVLPASLTGFKHRDRPFTLNLSPVSDAEDSDLSSSEPATPDKAHVVPVSSLHLSKSRSRPPCRLRLTTPVHMLPSPTSAMARLDMSTFTPTSPLSASDLSSTLTCNTFQDQKVSSSITPRFGDKDSMSLHSTRASTISMDASNVPTIPSNTYDISTKSFAVSNTQSLSVNKVETLSHPKFAFLAPPEKRPVSSLACLVSEIREPNCTLSKAAAAKHPHSASSFEPKLDLPVSASTLHSLSESSFSTSVLCNDAAVKMFPGGKKEGQCGRVSSVNSAESHSDSVSPMLISSSGNTRSATSSVTCVTTKADGKVILRRKDRSQSSDVRPNSIAFSSYPKCDLIASQSDLVSSHDDTSQIYLNHNSQKLGSSLATPETVGSKFRGGCYFEREAYSQITAVLENAKMGTQAYETSRKAHSLDDLVGQGSEVGQLCRTCLLKQLSGRCGLPVTSDSLSGGVCVCGTNTELYQSSSSISTGGTPSSLHSSLEIIQVS